MEKVNFEIFIERLKKDTLEHGAITGEYCGVYGVLADKWQTLLNYRCRLDRCDNSYKEQDTIWRHIDENIDFVSGMLFGLEAGRLITSVEHDILKDILLKTAYPLLDNPAEE